MKEVLCRRLTYCYGSGDAGYKKDSPSSHSVDVRDPLHYSYTGRAVIVRTNL